VRLCLADVGYSAPCCGARSSSENGGNPVIGIEVCVDNRKSGNDDQASASRQSIGCNDQGSVGGINSRDGNQASVDRQNSEEDDQVSVGGINSGDGDQASVDRQNSEEDDQVSVGGQDSRDCDEACQAGPDDLSLLSELCSSPDILEEIVRQTLRLYPYMHSSLRAVSQFFVRNIVEREPLPRVYIPELVLISNLVLFKLR